MGFSKSLNKRSKPYPENIFVIRRGVNKKENYWLEAYEDIEEFKDGEVVAIYKLECTHEVQVKVERKLV